MIVYATGKDTGKAAYIFVKDIVRTESMKEGPCSFTRVFLKEEKQNHEYFLDVLEKRDEIKRRIKEEQHIPGKEKKEEGDGP